MFKTFHILFFILIIGLFPAKSGEIKKLEKYSFNKNNEILELRDDSLHQLNFKYADKKRGIKTYIAPAILISTGTTLHFMTDAKQNFRNYTQSHFAYHGNFDEYAQYAPLATVYAFNALGLKGKNNFGNVTAISIKSLFLNGLITNWLKIGVNELRPNGGKHSFPSGHTSTAFALAQIMHKEFGEKNVWFSIGAYSCATTVGIMRVAKDAHWISDVIAGAGIGILSTELIYLTHQYKWDNEHIKRLDIFPFQTGKQKGICLVYTF